MLKLRLFAFLFTCITLCRDVTNHARYRIEETMTNHRTVSIDGTLKSFNLCWSMSLCTGSAASIEYQSDYVMLLVNYHEPICSNFR